jgi:hypothetical protein
MGFHDITMLALSKLDSRDDGDRAMNYSLYLKKCGFDA